MSPRHARRGVSHEHFHEVPGHVQLHLADSSPRVEKVRPRDVFDTLGCAPLLPSMIAHLSVHGQSVPAICWPLGACRAALACNFEQAPGGIRQHHDCAH